MILGIVRGEIYSTINHPFYDKRKILVVDRCEADFTPTGRYLIAVDGTAPGAGLGQRVLVINEGNGSRQVFAAENAPVRPTVVGIVDEVHEAEG
ncbi:MAG: hypothetical protein HY744_23785 [Deltaproteobacteria bacterium]|nr:hypothetical protein [Deltaproteobacteria bacterium]